MEWTPCPAPVIHGGHGFDQISDTESVLYNTEDHADPLLEISSTTKAA